MLTVLCLLSSLGAGVLGRPVLASAAVNTYYVATNGSDANPGTLASPFLTVQKAVGVAHSGDVVIVRGGTYNDRVLLDSWNVATNLTVRAYPGERPLVTQGFFIGQSGTTIDGFEVSSNNITDNHGYTVYAGIEIRANNVTVKNCYVHDMSDNSGTAYSTRKYHGIMVNGNFTGVEIVGNTVTRTGYHGIFVSGASAQAHIASNTVSYAGYDSTAASNPDIEAGYAESWGMGIWIDGNGTVCEGNTVTYSWQDCIEAGGTNNIIRHNDLQAIYPVAAWRNRGHKAEIYETPGTRGNVYDGNIFRESDGCLFELDTASSTTAVNPVIINNVFVGPMKYLAGLMLACRLANPGHVAYIYNNTFLTPGMYQSTLGTWPTGAIHVKDNVFAHGYAFFEATGADYLKYDHDYNLYATTSELGYGGGSTAAHEAVADPMLDSTYHLSSGSPAIGFGLGPAADSMVPTTDASGTARTGSRASAGAYEYLTAVPAPDVTPPGPVTGLAVARTGGATLTWVNPGDADFAAVRVLRSSNNFAVSATDTVGQVDVYDGSAATCQDPSVPSTAAYYTVFACDKTGNWSVPATVQLAAAPDTTAPSVALSAPTDGATVGGLVSVSALASDAGSGMSKVVFRVDGTTLATDTAAPYVATWDATNASVGQHTITATAYDIAGNSATSSVTVTVPDLSAPSVAFTQPANGSTVSGSVSLVVSASDNVGVARVVFKVDGAGVATDAVAPFTATWNAGAATPGAHTITATAYDAAGNTAVATISLNVPTPPDTTPPAAVTNLTVARTGSATLTWTNPTDADFAGVRVLRSIAGYAANASDTVGQTDIYDGTANTYHDLTAPNVATYYSVFAHDVAGNWSPIATVFLAAAPDTTPPTTTAQVSGSPAASGYYLTAPSVTLSANETATVYYQWDGTTAAWSTYSAPVVAPEGTHTLYFYSVDLAGNAETPKSVGPFAVDTIAPSSSAVLNGSPAASGYYTSIPSVTLSANEAAVISYQWDSSAAAGYATYSAPLSAPQGLHTLYYFATDVAGNAETPAHSLQLNVDTIAPAAPARFSAASGDTTATLSWTPAADAAATRVLRSASGFAGTPADAAQTVVYEGSATTAADSGLTDGTTYYYTAFSRDAAGNWSTAATATALPQAAPRIAAPLATSMTLSASPNKVYPGYYTTLSAKLMAGGAPVAGRTDVQVWKKVGSGAWTFDTTATYNPTTGAYEAKRQVSRQTSFQYRFAGSSSGNQPLAASTSNTVTVKTSTNVAKTVAYFPSRSLKSTVALVVNTAGPPPTSAVAVAYRSVRGRWVATTSFRLSAKSTRGVTTTWAGRAHLRKRGTWRFEVKVIDENGVTYGARTHILRVR